MPVIIAASNDIDNSVMVAGVNEFVNHQRCGVVMRMNSDALKLVSLDRELYWDMLYLS